MATEQGSQTCSKRFSPEVLPDLSGCSNKWFLRYHILKLFCCFSVSQQPEISLEMAETGRGGPESIPWTPFSKVRRPNRTFVLQHYMAFAVSILIVVLVVVVVAVVVSSSSSSSSCVMVGYGKIWSDMGCHVMAWYGMVWYGTVRYGTAWCGMVRCGVVWCGGQHT